ncbi:MAG TPA: clostripain-related cysteine peptidase [Armatimonadota bacterium]|nr:clostripain-related cysteine peptidase [Armatimonadota bacterium]
MRTLLFLLVTTAMVFCIVGCGGGHSNTSSQPQDTVVQSKWTVLVYMSADSNLKPYAFYDLNEMERGVPTSAQFTNNPSVQVLTQLDCPDTTTKRYKISHDTTSVVTSSYYDLGKNLDASNPQNFSDFLKWGCEKAPADNYLVVLWSHGSGWNADDDNSTRPTGAIIYDANTGNFIRDYELQPAIASVTGLSGKLRVLGFDACLMNTLEVADEVKNCANYMVGSEELEPGSGYDYTSTLQSIIATQDNSGNDVACHIESSAIAAWKNEGDTDCTFSVIDLSKVDPVVTAVNALAERLIATHLLYSSNLVNIRENMIPFATSDRHLYDLSDYAQRIKDNIPDQTTVQAADALITAIGACVVKSDAFYTSYDPGAHGLSIYLPPATVFVNTAATSYAMLALSQESQWDEWLSVTP